MKKIEVSEDTLRELLLSYDKLNSLEAGGVDNWDFYSESLSDHNDEDLLNLIEENPEEALKALFTEEAK